MMPSRHSSYSRSSRSSWTRGHGSRRASWVAAIKRRIGQRVEVVFDDIDEELTLHGFRIVEPCDSAGIKRLRQTLYPDIQSQQPAGMDFGGELVGRKAEPSRRHVKRRKVGAAEG